MTFGLRNNYGNGVSRLSATSCRFTALYQRGITECFLICMQKPPGQLRITGGQSKLTLIWNDLTQVYSPDRDSHLSPYWHIGWHARSRNKRGGGYGLPPTRARGDIGVIRIGASTEIPIRRRGSCDRWRIDWRRLHINSLWLDDSLRLCQVINDCPTDQRRKQPAAPTPATPMTTAPAITTAMPSVCQGRCSQ